MLYLLSVIHAVLYSCTKIYVNLTEKETSLSPWANSAVVNLNKILLKYYKLLPEKTACPEKAAMYCSYSVVHIAKENFLKVCLLVSVEDR